jgi:hypothetical protein
MVTEGSRDIKRVPYETFIHSRRQIHTNILNRKVVVKGQEGMEGRRDVDRAHFVAFSSSQSNNEAQRGRTKCGGKDLSIVEARTRRAEEVGNRLHRA